MNEELTLQQERFCRLYTQNNNLFGNATLSYADAYQYNLEELSQESLKDDKGLLIFRSSEHDKAYDTCSSLSSRLLRNDKIQDRITILLNELLKDEVVDSQLARLIMQDFKPETKIAAIREYNKLKQRIIEKIDHTTKGEKIDGLVLTKAQEVAKKYEEELKQNL